jgi:hypothetical protein
MFHSLDNTTLEEFLEFFQHLEGWSDEIRPYNSIYVSIGGKQNETYHTFQYPTQLKDTPLRTNAPYQMIPSFIANRRPDSGVEDRILVLIIDTFRTPEDWSTNCRIIQQQMVQRSHLKDTTSGICHAILWNMEMNTRTLVPTIQVILKMACIHHIHPNHTMICNYIRFSHPNDHEAVIEDYVPEKIQSLVDETPYTKRFYQWYGPAYYTYNMVYCYSDFHIWRSMYQSQLHHMFEKHCGKYPLNHITMQSIRNNYEEDSRTSAIINKFASCTIDIKESYRKRGEIASNLMI